jgi:hypothetical protein
MYLENSKPSIILRQRLVSNYLFRILMSLYILHRMDNRCKEKKLSYIVITSRRLYALDPLGMFVWRMLQPSVALFQL